MLLYTITNRTLLPGSETARCAALVALARHWAQHGVDFIQIREKDLPMPELLALTEGIVAAVRSVKTRTRVLLNGPAEIALAVGADGVHLPSGADTNAGEQARSLYEQAGKRIVLSRACHTLADVEAAREGGGDDPLILYAPVFEKVTPDRRIPGYGLDALRLAVGAASPIPVFALGGVTTGNARSCIAAGAAGIAGIRLFLNEDWQTLAAL